MKSQLILSSALILGLIGGGTVASVNALVASADDGGTYTTQAGVTFTPNTNPTNPVDPDNPDPNKPVNPVDPNGKDPHPGTNGPLSIDYVSDFDFGKQMITSSNQTYYAKAQGYKGDTKPTALYSQVSDNRGNGAGWQLGVKQDSQLNNGKDDLKGAAISIKNLNVNGLSGSDITAPTSGSDMTLVPGGGDQTVMSAAKGAGQGTWVSRMGSTANLLSEKGTALDGSDRTVDKSVSLYVPGASNKSVANQYSTTLTWTLKDTPANS
ncbi:WxL domain-containing protein [Weissella viridescens]|uniref:WxL domain-containing protein n=1 Tax=Weissella viridescens TaxID=1629 RepID=UPI003AF243E9